MHGTTRAACITALTEKIDDSKIYTFEAPTEQHLHTMVGAIARTILLHPDQPQPPRESKCDMIIMVLNADKAYMMWTQMRDRITVHLTPAEATYLAASGRPVPSPANPRDPRRAVWGRTINIMSVNFYRQLAYLHQAGSLLSGRVLVMADIAGAAESDLISRLVMETGIRRILIIDLLNTAITVKPFTCAEHELYQKMEGHDGSRIAHSRPSEIR